MNQCCSNHNITEIYKLVSGFLLLCEQIINQTYRHANVAELYTAKQKNDFLLLYSKTKKNIQQNKKMI